MNQRGQGRLLRASAGLSVLIGGPSLAQQIDWDRSCGSNFWTSTCGQNTNWDPERLPDINDLVMISIGSSQVQLNGLGLAQEILAESTNGLWINGGTLRLGGGGGYIVNLTAETNVGNLIDFTVPGTELNLQNTVTWRIGRISGDGVVTSLGATINPTIHSSAMTIELLNSAHFRNDAGGAATFRFITIGADSLFENLAGAQLTSYVDHVGGHINGAGVFSNAGTVIVHHAIPSTRPIHAFFSQTAGELIVRGAPAAQNTVFTNAGNWSGGVIVIEDDTNIRFQHPGAEPLAYVFSGLTSITGDGNLFVEIPSFAPITADWQVTAPLEVNLTGSSGFVIGGNRLTLGSTLTNTGKAMWVSGTIRTTGCTQCEPVFHNTSSDFVIQAASNSVSLAAPFLNEGRIDQVQGNLILLENGVIHNGAEYNLIRGDIRDSTNVTNEWFVNFGVVRKPDLPETQDSTISARFGITSTGRLEADKGTIFLNNGNNSPFEAATGGVIHVSGGATIRHLGGVVYADLGQGNSAYPKIEGAGRFTVETPATANNLFGAFRDAGWRLSMTGTAPDGFHFISGRIGLGQVLNDGNFYWTGGVMGVDGGSSEDDIRFSNFGTVYQSGGTLRGDRAFLTNQPLGVVNQTGTLTTQESPEIRNRSAWNVIPGTGPSTFSIGPSGTFINESSASINVTSIVPSGVYNMTLGLDNEGTLLVGPNTRVNMQGSVVGLDNGILTKGTWIIQPGGVLDYPGARIRAIGEGVAITSSGASTPDVDPDANEGTLTCNGDWTFSESFTNYGDCSVTDGTLEAVGGFTNDGGSCRAEGGAFRSTLDFNNLSGECTAAGGRVISLEQFNNGGFSSLAWADDEPIISLRGSAEPGFVCDTFNNLANGIIRPGGPDAPGPFRLAGNLNLTAGGAVEIELGGLIAVDEHDQVVVQGDVTLGGTLRLSLLNPYVPTIGDGFVILTATGDISAGFHTVDVDGLNGRSATVRVESDRVVVVIGGSTELTGLQVLTGTLLGGTLDDLRASDDAPIRVRSGFGRTFTDLHSMELAVDAVTNVPSPSLMHLTIEGRVSHATGGLARVRLLDHNTTQLVTIGQYAIPNADLVRTFNSIPAGPYVSEGGDIRVQFRTIVVVPIFAFTYDTFVDHLHVVVE